ncbi:MAG: Type prenyl endopeptidase Rce1-like [Actinomycetota bacterium]
MRGFALRLVRDVGLLVLSAAVEELLFRVGLIALFTKVVSPAVAVVIAAAAFGPFHVLRGKTAAERIGDTTTAFGFAVLLGWVWVTTRSFAFIAGFHAAFNITGGLVFGEAAMRPISDRMKPATWPLAMSEGGRVVSPVTKWTVLVMAELVSLAVAAAIVVVFRS